MELVPILATVILLATVLTLVFAFASYFVSRAKRRAKREAGEGEKDGEVSPVRTYFERYIPEGGLRGDARPEEKSSRQDSKWL